MPRSVLVVTEDRVGEVLGGAAIRAYEIARSLSDMAEVTLAAPGTEPPGLRRHGTCRSSRRSPPAAGALPRRRRGDHASAQPARGRVAARVEGADRLRPLRSAPARHPRGAGLGLARAATALAHHRARPLPRGASRRPPLHLQRAPPARPLRGRDARVAPDTSRRVRVPTRRFARSSTRCRSASRRSRRGAIAGAGPRARLPAIGEDAQIVLWNGGIWNWLDPSTAVAATVRAAERHPRVRLVFMFARGACADPSSARRARPVSSPSGWGRSTGSCSSTRSAISYADRGDLADGRRLRQCRRTSTTSSPTSPSGPGCSTASGRGCRRCAPAATS